MRTIKAFRVVPALSPKLQPLATIARNLWWVWTPYAIDLFRRLDIEGFSDTGHNPTALLGMLDQEKLLKLEKDPSFMAHLDQVLNGLNNYLAAPTWFHDLYADKKDFGIAYFSAEYGLHESLPIYSGGLGVLSGDHLKSASDTGLPLYGVGLLYRQGYFRQYLNADGWQQEIFPENDFYILPLSLEKNANGEPVMIELELPDKILYAQIWTVNIGRIQLYLLDANIEKNDIPERMITAQLYGGDSENRIKQEMLLGIGGIRALAKLGKKIQVFHMNEGHSAFLALERIRDFMENQHLSLEEALYLVQSTNVFTTHTPVPAGIDRFDSNMILRYLESIRKKIKLSPEELLALGRESHNDPAPVFSMATLALKLAAHCNGVSKLHGEVSRKMWHNMWPNVPHEEIPIDHITNGIHIKSWLSDEMSRLFDRYVGPTWRDENRYDRIAERIQNIPNSELWRSKERLRERLVSFARTQLKKQLIEKGASQIEIQQSDEVLDSEVLTIGFARRFATYKRATLIFQDIERLSKILNHKEKPVQIIFAGKAHPQDMEGKKLIKELIHLARREDLHSKIIFLEDYDISIARHMVQGVDVWLNTPRRPHEASGTSGMKVPINGGLNLSILDGWWVEGYQRDNGWAIGNGEEYDDYNYQDRIESQALLDLLEKDLVPTFYDRGSDDLPRDWIQMMKNSMASLTPVFNANRMLKEYTEKYYVRCHENYQKLTANNFEKVKNIAQWFKKIKKDWHQVKVKNIYHEKNGERPVGSEIEIKADVTLGQLGSEDVILELIYGFVGPTGDIIHTKSIVMKPLDTTTEADTITYHVKIQCVQSGNFGYAVRVLPYHPDQTKQLEPGFIIWG